MPYQPDYDNVYGGYQAYGQPPFAPQGYRPGPPQQDQMGMPQLPYQNSPTMSGHVNMSSQSYPAPHAAQRLPSHQQSWQQTQTTPFQGYPQGFASSQPIQPRVYQNGPQHLQSSASSLSQSQAMNQQAFWQQQAHQPQAYAIQHYPQTQQHPQQLPVVQTQPQPRPQVPQNPPQQWHSSQPPRPQSGLRQQSSVRLDQNQPPAHKQHASRPIPQSNPDPNTYSPAPKLSQTPQSQSRPEPKQPQQRTVAHVQVPIQQQPNMELQQTPQTRSPKRRRSNDGTAVPVYQRPPSPSPTITPHLLVKNATTVDSSPLSELRSSQVPPPPPPQPEVDLNNVLLALADEYIDNAHSMTSSLSHGSSNDEEIAHYHSLMAAGLSCLECVLQKFRQSNPRKEARIRIRLATLLHEETENSAEAEEVLGKGIALCERNRLTDLKYTMHHLRIRITRKTSAKAALKAVDKIIAEVDALKLIPWIYIFRFMKVAFSFQTESGLDNSAVVRQLAAISTLADSQAHVSIKIIAATTEAVAHFRLGTTEGLDLAQRAMATVRSYQLSPQMEQLPQIRVLLDCLELGCRIVGGPVDQMANTMQQMQANQEAASKSKAWADDGLFSVPIGIKTGKTIPADTGGLLTESDQGGLAMTFAWLTKAEMFTLGYALSGVASIPRNGELRKAEAFLKEALKINRAKTDGAKTSLTSKQAALARHQDLNVSIQLLLALVLAGRADYKNALSICEKLQKEFSSTRQPSPVSTSTALRYIVAVCKQGLGQLKEALALYQSEIDALNSDSKAPQVIKDIRMLSALNAVHIIRALSPNRQSDADTLLKSVEPLCFAHPNKAFLSAYHILKSTTAPKASPIITMKSDLNHALSPAQAVKNKQLLSIIMNIMSEMFFTDIVGDQAMKSANAGRTLARQSGDRLWDAVGSGMYRDTLERSGKLNEAAEVNKAAQGTMSALPQAVRDSLQQRK